MTDTDTKATEDQGTTDGSEKLIDGKYKSQAEVLAALKDYERENNNLKESLDRETRLNKLLDEVTSPPKQESYQAPAADEFGEEFDENQKAKIQQILNNREQTIYQRVGSLVENKLNQRAEQSQAVNSFYKSYPDLVGFEDMVEMHATKLQRELGPKAAQASPDKLAKELALRVKTSLTETKKKLTKSSLHIEGGGMEEHRTSHVEEDAEPTSDQDRLAKYFKDEVPAFNKKKRLSGM